VVVELVGDRRLEGERWWWWWRVENPI